MNHNQQFEALSETEATNINGGGLLDLLYPSIIISDPLGLVGTLVDPIVTPVVTGALNAGQSIVNGLTSAINSLLGSFLPH